MGLDVSATDHGKGSAGKPVQRLRHQRHADQRRRLGPGTITITGDILISPMVTIVITPNTTVQVATTDGANLGIDSNRIEYIVGGTLLVSGPVTFTSQRGRQPAATGMASASGRAPAGNWTIPPSNTAWLASQ
jgi:hypothetical protein